MKTITVKKTLEEVRQDAKNKEMEVIERSAYPFQHLEGIILKKGDITIYAWKMSETEVTLDRA
jgi:hypothetical protein